MALYAEVAVEAGRALGRETFTYSVPEGVDVVPGRPEAVVARFALPSHGSTVDSQVRRVSVGASIKRGISGGWVLAEQCRAGDLVNALHDARASDVAIRGAQDVERLLGRPIEDDARLAS